MGKILKIGRVRAGPLMEYKASNKNSQSFENGNQLIKLSRIRRGNKNGLKSDSPSPYRAPTGKNAFPNQSLIMA